MTLRKANISIGFDVKAETSEGNAKGTDAFSENSTTTFTPNATGAGCVNKEWNDSRSISGASNDNLDFSGALVNRLNEAAVFTKIQGIYLKNSDTSTGTLTYGGGSNPIPGIPAGTLAPGERIAFDAGVIGVGKAVTNSTGDMLNLSSSASLDYEIGVVGQ